MRPVIPLAAVVAVSTASLSVAGDVSALPESKRLALAKAVSFAADAEQIKKADIAEEDLPKGGRDNSRTPRKR